MRPVEKWDPANEPRINDNYPNYKDAKHPPMHELGHDMFLLRKDL